MDVKLFTKNHSLQRVQIDCTPIEYLVLNKAIHLYADVNPDDVKTAERMLAEGKDYLYEEGEEE